MTNFITLNNGYQIPQLGFGTIQQFGKQIEDNVAFALNHGYQLIDTANRYGNEVEVGKGLKLSGLKRFIPVSVARDQLQCFPEPFTPWKGFT